MKQAYDYWQDQPGYERSVASSSAHASMGLAAERSERTSDDGSVNATQGGFGITRL
ncbi:MAG: hypothetical protein GY753_05275 [Gammaproteobacteria bacterium]|nr:hypothetical protein [Gammaproteobacteria bacterium]